MSKDTLFRTEPVSEDFRFTDQVAEVFDDMLHRSIPNYRQVIEMSSQLLERHLVAGDTVYDLGCSTGACLLELAQRLTPLSLHFKGIDNSPAMIAKARSKTALYAVGEQIQFEEGDIGSTAFEGAGAVVLNYTLQFIRPLERPIFLKKIHAGLRPGGLLILSEKVLGTDPRLNRDYIECYLQFKRGMGYSEIEISRKREALENVLIPFTIAENHGLLRDAGFSGAETFCQWFNFASFVAIR